MKKRLERKKVSRLTTNPLRQGKKLALVPVRVKKK